MRSPRVVPSVVLALSLVVPALAQEPPAPKPAEGGEAKKAEEPAKPVDPAALREEARAAFAAFDKKLAELEAFVIEFEKIRPAIENDAQQFQARARAAYAKDPKNAEAAIQAIREEFQKKYGEILEKRQKVQQETSAAYEKAGPLLDKAIGDKPDEAPPELRLAKARLLLAAAGPENLAKVSADALPHAEAAAKALEKDSVAQITLAKCLLGINQYERAGKVLAAIPAEVAAAREVQGRLVIALYAQNRFAEAKAVIDKLQKLDDLPADVRGVLEQWKPEELVALWTKEEELRAAEAKKDDLPRVKLETTRGDIVLELFEDAAPNTVANYVSLVEKGYYDKTTFHRVLPNFMAQGGDPQGTGMGGPGYRIKDELDEKLRRAHFRGTLSMAKSQEPDSGGSQFFITTVPTAWLNGIHTVFGRVLEGQEVVDKLEIGDEIKKATVLRKRAHDYKPETIAEAVRPGHGHPGHRHGEDEGEMGGDHEDTPPAKDEPKKDEPKKDEPKKDEPKKDEPKKDEPAPPK